MTDSTSSTNLAHDQAALNRYFSEYWVPNHRDGQLTNHARLSKMIKNTERVLDVGCGQNDFKKYGIDVWGIDPAFDEADEKCTIEEYQPQELFDVATCLGSINFGEESVISAQIAKVVSCLKPNARVYWRLNPGRKDHPHPECESVPFYPWSFERLRNFAYQHGFQQVEESVERDDHSIRLFAIWVRY